MSRTVAELREVLKSYVADAQHRRLGQHSPPVIQGERDLFAHDMSMADVNRVISPLHMNRTQPALPTKGIGSYPAQFHSTTSLLEHTVPGMRGYNADPRLWTQGFKIPDYLDLGDGVVEAIKTDAGWRPHRKGPGEVQLPDYVTEVEL